MNKEKPEVQKIVIDMGHTWTPEERQQKEQRERNEKETDNSQEQKEYPKKFSSAREYIKNLISLFDNPSGDADEEIMQEWQEAEADLDCGNERAVMEKLEYMAGAQRSTSKTKKDSKLWRKAIFEITKETSGTSRLMNSEAISGALYDEYMKLDEEMIKVLDENPGDFNDKDRQEYKKEVSRWHNAFNEVANNGRLENAMILLEEEINDKVRDDHDLRREIEQVTKGKSPNIDYINRTKEKIKANSNKLATYRRMRDSLYAIEFNDKK
ncbi:MAG: hypothetical protein WAV16_01580 [Candidatus Moraniibacteriota bacterium]